MDNQGDYDQKKAFQLIAAFTVALGVGYFAYANGGYKIFKDEPTCPVSGEVAGEDVPALDSLMGLCDEPS